MCLPVVLWHKNVYTYNNKSSWLFLKNSERQRLPIWGSWSRPDLLIPLCIPAKIFDILIITDCKCTYVALDELTVREFGLSDSFLFILRGADSWQTYYRIFGVTGRSMLLHVLNRKRGVRQFSFYLMYEEKISGTRTLLGSTHLNR